MSISEKNHQYYTIHCISTFGAPCICAPAVAYVYADSTLHQWNLSQLSIYKLYTEHTDLVCKGSNTTQKIDFSTYSGNQKLLIQCKFHKK